MSKIHMVLQGKGGVGKSLICALIAQKLVDDATGLKPEDILCVDTDPVNATFAGYKFFNVVKTEILDGSSDINKRMFDSLIETMANSDKPTVVDNGSTSFLPMSSYMAENSVIPMLEQMGKEVILHSVLTGGQATDDTISGLTSVLKTQPAKVVVWQNEYFGPVVRDGRPFSESKLYEKFRHKILGVITVRKLNQDTSARDMEIMISNRLTFKETMESPLFSLMPRHRLLTVKKDIFSQLDAIGI
ncbi:hypothetical protein UNDKW_5923 (plasmid) [Undibacterium sp. KW1]|uniref:conjugal transfer protein TraL n=1 Tax=Undibacterium sp. KW1 TaxID=2058624 RepID=UPI001331E02F|nr:conjugal transfer protein TraL [Undibacterium sp. KW1]BBB64196.1 hypothetical protein UNDKW_5923 [Undibacterium sp. KW1]